MKIYFGMSIAGGQSHLKGGEKIVAQIRELGHEVKTGFVIGEPYESGYPTDNAWARDIPLLQECDVMIAEISQMSTGVGIELGVAAVAYGKPVLCLRDETLQGERYSSLIRQGPYRTEHYSVDDLPDLTETLQSFFSDVELQREGRIIKERS